VTVLQKENREFKVGLCTKGVRNRIVMGLINGCDSYLIRQI